MKKTLFLILLIFQFTSFLKSQNKQIIVDNNNRFAIDIYKKLQDSNNNLVFSPFSISSAMAMTYAGAENKTAKEFQKILYFLEDKPLFHQEFGKLFQEIVADKKSSVELIVMDLGMPGMGGRQCLRELVRLDPEVRVLIASGYATGKLDQEVQLDGAAGFINKPFQFSELLAIVRQVLKGAEA